MQTNVQTAEFHFASFIQNLQKLTPPSNSSSLLTFFTQGSLLSPFFFFFSIAACVTKLQSNVWFEAFVYWGGGPPLQGLIILQALPPSASFQPPLSCNPAQTGPTMCRQTQCNELFPPLPFGFFLPLSPSLPPLYSYLIVDCLRDWVTKVSGIKTKAKFCPCWLEVVAMCSVRLLKRWWKTTECWIHCSTSKSGTKVQLVSKIAASPCQW